MVGHKDLFQSIRLHEQDVRNFDQYYKQDYMKALLNSFHLNGHTLGFHPQTLKLEPSCTA